MKPSYLFDASSLVKALKEAKLVPLGGQVLQWLTIYEVLNVFWEESYLLHRLSIEEAVSLTRDFTDLVLNMIILEPRGLEHDILQIAVSRGITAYDASYIALARKHGLTLVTEDQILAKASTNMVKTVSLDDIK
ncbi:conserved hypothetical protein [Staphylothermus marinus F1]|uniref:PIN domain-containing protein n=1 Tax=Staphylothermus marinus (strain ATCC 43588 / DSM 3639 / JCM 9404 / F1) TaxID=399550 RepID=A3DPQ7_STAMF|nr:type II toxin-antitoxin system VapC family toxin [Staphylothermus marinus]ABN70617.1 conserved hypothetical protein [Staphylothermus marinus F1]